MELTKGYTLESGDFIPELSKIKVVLTTGEIVEGLLLKPAKKEFRVIAGELTRVLKIAEVSSLEMA